MQGTIVRVRMEPRTSSQVGPVYSFCGTVDCHSGYTAGLEPGAVFRAGVADQRPWDTAHCCTYPKHNRRAFADTTHHL